MACAMHCDYRDYSLAIPLGTTGEDRDMQEPTTLSVDEYAALVGVSRDAVYDAVRRGEIRAVRVGRLIRIPRQPVLDALGI